MTINYKAESTSSSPSNILLLVMSKDKFNQEYNYDKYDYLLENVSCTLERFIEENRSKFHHFLQILVNNHNLLSKEKL